MQLSNVTPVVAALVAITALSDQMLKSGLVEIPCFSPSRPHPANCVFASKALFSEGLCPVINISWIGLDVSMSLSFCDLQRLLPLRSEDKVLKHSSSRSSKRFFTLQEIQFEVGLSPFG